MALWIDDTIHHQREWYSMSAAAVATLVELWAEAKVAKNNGVFETDRLFRVAPHFTTDALGELVANGWVHRDASGCGTEWCPKGVSGHIVMHNFLRRQESKEAMNERLERSLESKKEAAKRTNHERWHVNRNKVDPKCELCVSAGQIASIA